MRRRNTQVDKVRAVIIDGLGMAPVRDKYKIFIIDEVHRLSPQSFDALLKSIEEPPPHVVFMMATTEIDKVPPTIQSRSQVFELKTIGVKQIADQLRAIAVAEKIAIDDAALMLIARAGDGSMRDAQSAFDQIIGFAGTTIGADDVSTVLGLVRRDLLIAIADAVGREDAAAVFDLAAQAVDSGYDLRLVVRELARMTRDLLIVSIDPSRVSDPEIAAEAERQALLDLSRRFSSEDLMRAFDVLTKAEYEIRGCDAAALSAGDGAAALDPPAQAGAAHRSHQAARGGRRDTTRRSCPAGASRGTCRRARETRPIAGAASDRHRSRQSWAGRPRRLGRRNPARLATAARSRQRAKAGRAARRSRRSRPSAAPVRRATRPPT